MVRTASVPAASLAVATIRVSTVTYFPIASVSFPAQAFAPSSRHGGRFSTDRRVRLGSDWSVPVGCRLVDSTALVRCWDVVASTAGQGGDTRRRAGADQQGQYVSGHTQ